MVWFFFSIKVIIMNNGDNSRENINRDLSGGTALFSKVF